MPMLAHLVSARSGQPPRRRLARCDAPAEARFPSELRDRYKDVVCLGMGAWNVVFKATDIQSGDVAILKLSKVRDEVKMRQNYRDCQYVNNLHLLGCSHGGAFEEPGAAHLMRCYGTNSLAVLGMCQNKSQVGSESQVDQASYVMLENAGDSLPKFMQKAADADRWGLTVLAEILRGLIESVGFLARAGFNHGDFHPENIGLSWNDRPSAGINEASVLVKLMDLGSAKISVNNDLLNVASHICMAMYVPPFDVRNEDFQHSSSNPSDRDKCANKILAISAQISADPVAQGMSIGAAFASELNKGAFEPAVNQARVAQIWTELLASEAGRLFIPIWAGLLKGTVTAEVALSSRLLKDVAKAQPPPGLSAQCKPPPTVTTMSAQCKQNSNGCDSNAVEELKTLIASHSEVLASECQGMQAVRDRGVFEFCTTYAAGRHVQSCIGECQYNRRWCFMDGCAKLTFKPYKVQCAQRSLVPLDPLLLCSDMFTYDAVVESWPHQLEVRPAGSLADFVAAKNQGSTSVWLYGIFHCPFMLASDAAKRIHRHVVGRQLSKGVRPVSHVASFAAIGMVCSVMCALLFWFVFLYNKTEYQALDYDDSIELEQE